MGTFSFVIVFNFVRKPIIGGSGPATITSGSTSSHLHSSSTTTWSASSTHTTLPSMKPKPHQPGVGHASTSSKPHPHQASAAHSSTSTNSLSCAPTSGPDIPPSGIPVAPFKNQITTFCDWLQRESEAGPLCDGKKHDDGFFIKPGCSNWPPIWMANYTGKYQHH
jgi:hypothetical protein